MLPIDISRFQLRYGGVTPVRTTQWSPHAEAPLREIQPVPNRAANSIELHPSNQRAIHAAVADHPLDQPSDRVLGERGDDCGIQSETAREAPRYVVFSAAFPRAELPSRMDAVLAWIETQHHFA